MSRAMDCIPIPIDAPWICTTIQLHRMRVLVRFVLQLVRVAQCVPIMGTTEDTLLAVVVLCPVAVCVDVKSVYFAVNGKCVDPPTVSVNVSPKTRILGCLLQQMPASSLTMGMMLLLLYRDQRHNMFSTVVLQIYQPVQDRHMFVIAGSPRQFCSSHLDHPTFQPLLHFTKPVFFALKHQTITVSPPVAVLRTMVVPCVQSQHFLKNSSQALAASRVPHSVRNSFPTCLVCCLQSTAVGTALVNSWDRNANVIRPAREYYILFVTIVMDPSCASGNVTKYSSKGSLAADVFSISGDPLVNFRQTNNARMSSRLASSLLSGSTSSRRTTLCVWLRFSPFLVRWERV